MATGHRPYQGYPYARPLVTDAPSISADEAARWQHLPRRQLELNVGQASNKPKPEVSLPAKRDSNQAPVVYIDLPQASGSIVADRRYSEDGFELVSPARPSTDKSQPEPVVYIDLPAENDIGAPASRGTPPHEPAFVQETIFYDPFENRRIDRAKDSDDDDDDSVQVPERRPNTLDLNGAGPSGSSYSSPIPPIMSKEADIYASRTQDDFPASPIPVSQFPEPPPAYAEIDTLSVPEPVVDQPRPPRTPRSPSPPRTQVIIRQENNVEHSTPTSMPGSDRKYLNCHHCGMRVHTLVVRKTGWFTHATAATACFMIVCIPCIPFIYSMDYFKVQNHYCPNCNKIIGYQQPISGDKIIYVNS